MPSIKDLKKRIGTVKNTQQTTKAMKMVSAAKLRRAQDAITNNRPYAKQIGSLVETMLALPDTDLKSPLLRRPGEGATEGKRLLLLVVTSDRGLCAGFNSNIIRSTQRWVKEHSKEYASIKLAFLGKRGFDFFRTKNYSIGPNFAEQAGKVTFKKAVELSSALVEMFDAGEIDEVKVIYNEFKNAVTQKVTLEQYLPLEAKDAPASADAKADAAPAGTRMVIVKPNPNEVLRALLEKTFSIQAFRIMLESQAGEHGARMSAMENATKNAGEMIKKLTLQYNKQRQAGITKELLEIIAGSESSK